MKKFYHFIAILTLQMCLSVTSIAQCLGIEEGIYKITNQTTTSWNPPQVLDVANGTYRNDNPILCYSDWGGENQLFKVTKVDLGNAGVRYTIQPYKNQSYYVVESNGKFVLNQFPQTTYCIENRNTIDNGTNNTYRYSITTNTGKLMSYDGNQKSLTAVGAVSDFGFLWKFSKLGQAEINILKGSEYYIQNIATGQFMSVPKNQDNGTLAMHTTEKGFPDSQKFLISNNSDGTSYIAPQLSNQTKSRESRLYLSVNGGGNNPNNTDLKMWQGYNQSFSKWKLEPKGNDIYVIRSAESQNLLLVHSYGPGSNSSIVQWNPEGWEDDRMKWRLIPASKITEQIPAGNYYIKNRATGKVMEVAGGGSNDGAIINQADKRGTSNQKFKLEFYPDIAEYIFGASYVENKYISVCGCPNQNGYGLTLSQPTGRGLLRYQVKLIDFTSEGVPVYTIKSKSDFGKLNLGVHNSDNPTIIQWNTTGNDDTRFQWTFEAATKEAVVKQVFKPGRYKIVNKATNKVWTVPGATLETTNLIEADNVEQANQQFEISINNNGKYIISPLHSRGSRYIVVNGTAPSYNTNGSPVSQYNLMHPAAEFEIYPLENIDAKTFGIRSTFSKLDIGVHNHSGFTQITQWGHGDVANDTRFQWTFEAVAETEYVKPGRYLIQNVATGKVMDVQGYQKSQGAAVVQWGFNGGENQKFEVAPNGNGYTMRALHTDNPKLYLNVCGCNNTDDFPINIWGEYWDVERFSLDFVGYDQSGNGLYAIKSMYSNLNVGVHDANNPKVMQWNHWGVKSDTRFQWRFLSTTSSRARELIEQSAEMASLPSPEPSLAVYPNPATDDFNVEIKEFSETDELSIVIADAMGNALLQKNIGKNRTLNFNAQTLNLKEQNYVIQISNGADKRVSKILKIDDK